MQLKSKPLKHKRSDVNIAERKAASSKRVIVISIRGDPWYWYIYFGEHISAMHISCKNLGITKMSSDYWLPSVELQEVRKKDFSVFILGRYIWESGSVYIFSYIFLNRHTHSYFKTDFSALINELWKKRKEENIKIDTDGWRKKKEEKN